jgi:mRNA interferase RelE/StbE
MLYLKMKTLILSAAAAKQLDALPQPAQGQIIDALDDYAMRGTGDVKRLVGRDGYRLRVGRYRVLFAEDSFTILAVYVGKRETTTYGRN